MEHKVMSYRGHFRALLVLGLPLIGGHLAQFAIGMTDTAMLGRYSAEALAAAVLGGLGISAWPVSIYISGMGA